MEKACKVVGMQAAKTLALREVSWSWFNHMVPARFGRRENPASVTRG